MDLPRGKGVSVWLRDILYVLRDAAPLMIAEILPSVASIVDIFFVSFLGDQAVAAVGVGGQVSWLLGVLLVVFYVGALVTVSQALGAGQKDKAKHIASETLSATLLFAIGLAVVGVYAAYPISLYLAHDQSVALLAKDYLYARFAGLPGLAALFVLDAVYRAAGANKDILASSLVASATNAVLDPILIYVLGMGVTGAGYATAIANYTGALYLLAFMKKSTGLKAELVKPSSNAFLAIRVGVPTGLERLFFSLGHTLYMEAVARCGTDALAAHTIGIRVESLAFMPAFALSTYASSIVGNHVGAGRLGEAKKAGWQAAKAAAAFMALMMTILILVAPFAGRALASSTEVAQLAAIYLWLAAITEPPLGVLMVISGAIRGAGNTTIPTLLNLAGLYLFRVLPAQFIVGRTSIELVSCPVLAWIIMDIDVALRGAVFAIVYAKYFMRLVKRLV
jgi:putative MATE family efflux protein